LVAEASEMSTPWANGLKKSGVAQVLSRAVNMPRLRATAVIAGTSIISNVCEPGVSM
jgi:hypothetical protein